MVGISFLKYYGAEEIKTVKKNLKCKILKHFKNRDLIDRQTNLPKLFVFSGAAV